MARKSTKVQETVVANNKGDEKMTNQKPEINVSVARNAKVEEIINALSVIDRNNAYQTHFTNELIETIMYDEYVKGNEIADVIYSFNFSDVKTVRTLANAVPFVLGCTYFSIEYNKDDKQGVLNFRVKTPYGNYREGLEARGLNFSAYQDKDHQQARNAEQQDAIAEANSILASVGLNFYAL